VIEIPLKFGQEKMVDNLGSGRKIMGKIVKVKMRLSKLTWPGQKGIEIDDWFALI
jgi:hypothetical protein